MMELTSRIRAYEIRVAMLPLHLPQELQMAEQAAAPQHDAPTDHNSGVSTRIAL